MLVCWYIGTLRVPMFLYFYVLSCLYDLAYLSSYGFTSFIEFTTSWMSSLSNRNTNNTRSVTLRRNRFINIIVVVNRLVKI